MIDKLTYKWLKIIICISLIYICYHILTHFGPVILPFILAYATTHILYPPIRYIKQRANIPYNLIATCMVTIFLIISVSITYMILHITITEATTLASQIPFMTEQLAILYESVFIPFYKKLSFPVDILPAIEQVFSIQVAKTLIQQQLGNLAEQVTIILSSISYMTTSFIVFIISMYMMTIDFPRINKLLQANIPLSFQRRTKDVIGHLQANTWKLVKAQLFMSFITACICFIGFLCLSFSHPITLSVLIFILDFLPYIGAGAVFIPFILYYFLTGSIVSTIGFVIIYVIILIFRQIMEPKVVGDSLGLHPLFILMILFTSIHTFGIIGILLMPVILICMAAIYHANILTDIWHYMKR